MPQHLLTIKDHFTAIACTVAMASATYAGDAPTQKTVWHWPQNSAQAAKIQGETLAQLALKHQRSTEKFAANAEDTPQLSWFWKRHRAAGSDNKLQFGLIHEDLLWSQRMLLTARNSGAKNGQDLAQRGLRVAHYAALQAGVALKDSHLRAQIYAGWILPHLNWAAKDSQRDISQQRLVEAAYNAFRRDGQIDNQRLALRLLIRYADRANTRDWARLKLAEDLAAHQQYAQAITYLERVQTPELAGSRALLPAWRAKAAAVAKAR